MRMTTEPEIQQEAPVTALCMECPLHVAMEEIAHVAVKQHVLYLEGECQPRPELIERLAALSDLHRFIRARVCVASRSASLSPDALDAALDDLIPIAHDAPVSSHVRRLRRALTVCAQAASCPLGLASTE